MTVTFGGRSPVSLAVAGTASVAVGFGFARYGFGLFVPVFRMEFGLDTQTIGAIGSGSYAVYLVSLLGCGVLSARWGPRLPVVTGTTFAFIGLTLVSLASTAEMLVVGILMAAASSGWVWAPFADAVARRVSPSQRARVLAVIGTGTTFGLIVAGSLAPLGSDRPTAWRPVWAGFALAAALATAASVLAIPGRRDGKKKRTRTRFRLTRKAFPLIGHGMLCGAVTSGYFTFAVDLVREHGLSAQWSSLLWLLLGVGGISGVATGEAARAVGLRRTLVICVVLLAASIAALAAFPSSPSIASAAAIGFGFAFMPIAAVLALWNQEVHPEHPTSGLTLVLCSLGVGSMVGPLVVGAGANSYGLRAVFFVLAGLTLLGIGLLPGGHPKDAAGIASRPASPSM
jgi:predicted MFS family arabinose efflux permease